jgi:regulator of RNase E activity RraA
MTPATRDKLLRVGAKAIVAALARHHVRGRDVARLPMQEPFAGEACLTIESARPGNVLVLDRPIARLPEKLLQRLAGVMTRRDLRSVPLAAGDVVLRDRTSLVVIPADLADQVAEEAAEAIAFEEFTAEQVNQGGGVYGLHIPSGERAKLAFAQWRRMKGR